MDSDKKKEKEKKRQAVATYLNEIFSQINPTEKSVAQVITKYLFDNNSDDLKSYLSKYLQTEEKKYAFFVGDQGSLILLGTLIHASSSQPLQLLVQVAPQKALKQTLLKDDFYYLKSFLNTQAALQAKSSFDEEARKNQIEKFKLFLKIGGKEVEDAMNNINSSVSNHEQIKKIKDNFNEAFEEYQNELNQEATPDNLHTMRV